MLAATATARNAWRLASIGILACGSAAADTRYVNVGLAGGLDNGSSWADAYRSADGVARALAASVAGDEIWVAAGTYKPTLTTTRTLYHDLRSGVGVYGGFAGAETARDQRDVDANPTLLSGDLAGNDPTVTDNSFHVVNGNAADATAVLDGFTITRGNATGAAASDRDRGGGLIFLNASNATVRNCLIVGNNAVFGGGGTYIRSSSPTFVDCEWGSNTGGSFGGAIDMFTNCSPTFTRCLFALNSATRAGGVEVFGNCQPVFTNTIFRANAAGTSGGGALFVASTSTVTLRHCTIVSNSSTGSGSAILSNSSTTRLFNSIVYFNNNGAAGQLAGATNFVTYSCVQNGSPGAGNISADPALANAPAGGWHLLPGSPCIDAASNADSGVGNTLDFDAAPRFVDDPATTDTGAGTAPIADMGALEFQAAPPACPADLNDDGQINLTDLSLLLTDFGCPQQCPHDIDGDGDADLSDLSILLTQFGNSCP
jgi:Right handed beta helix region